MRSNRKGFEPLPGKLNAFCCMLFLIRGSGLLSFDRQEFRETDHLEDLIDRLGDVDELGVFVLLLDSKKDA